MSYMTLPTIVKVRMNTTCTIISSKHAHIYKKKSPLWEMKDLEFTVIICPVPLGQNLVVW